MSLQTTWGGDKTMTSLLSNGSDIALIGSETSIYVEAQGAKDPVINFARLTQTDGTFLVSRKDEKSFKWSDLKGKTFLGQRKGGMPQMAGEYVLKKNHIEPKKTLTSFKTLISPIFPTHLHPERVIMCDCLNRRHPNLKKKASAISSHPSEKLPAKCRTQPLWQKKVI